MVSHLPVCLWCSLSRLFVYRSHCICLCVCCITVCLTEFCSGERARSRSREPRSETCGALVAHYGLRDGHFSLPSTRRRGSRSPSPMAAGDCLDGSHCVSLYILKLCLSLHASNSLSLCMLFACLKLSQTVSVSLPLYSAQSVSLCLKPSQSISNSFSLYEANSLCVYATLSPTLSLSVPQSVPHTIPVCPVVCLTLCLIVPSHHLDRTTQVYIQTESIFRTLSIYTCLSLSHIL